MIKDLLLIPTIYLLSIYTEIDIVSRRIKKETLELKKRNCYNSTRIKARV